MSDDNDSPSTPAPETEAPDGAAPEGADAPARGSATDDGAAPGDERARDSDAPAKARTDQDGLPLDREATLDDVRETHGVHGRYALGCTILIVATIVAFWLIRGGLGG